MIATVSLKRTDYYITSDSQLLICEQIYMYLYQQIIK